MAEEAPILNLTQTQDVISRAIDSISEVEQDVGATVDHIAIVYSCSRSDGNGNIIHSGGWNHSDSPDWIIATMLRRAANSIEADVETES